MVKLSLGTFTVGIGAIVVVDSVEIIVVVVVVVFVIAAVVVFVTIWPKHRGSLKTTMKKLNAANESIPLLSFV